MIILRKQKCNDMPTAYIDFSVASIFQGNVKLNLSILCYKSQFHSFYLKIVRMHILNNLIS